MYSYIKDSNQNNKTAIVIKEGRLIKNDLKRDDYKSTSFGSQQNWHYLIEL